MKPKKLKIKLIKKRKKENLKKKKLLRNYNKMVNYKVLIQKSFINLMGKFIVNKTLKN